jgi:hypothetical protein
MKSFVLSKTIWINVLSILLTFLETTAITDLIPNQYLPIVLAVVAALTIILRSIKGQQDLVLKMPAEVRRLNLLRHPARPPYNPGA